MIVNVNVNEHGARPVELSIIGAPKYCVIFRSNAEFAEP